jgi:hypothetical protein
MQPAGRAIDARPAESTPARNDRRIVDLVPRSGRGRATGPSSSPARISRPENARKRAPIVGRNARRLSATIVTRVASWTLARTPAAVVCADVIDTLAAGDEQERRSRLLLLNETSRLRQLDRGAIRYRVGRIRAVAGTRRRARCPLLL